MIISHLTFVIVAEKSGGVSPRKLVFAPLPQIPDNSSNFRRGTKRKVAEGRRILRKYGYPPDKQKKATQTVWEQAKLLCGDWAEQPLI